ncbi:MAG TPA: SBBP repeat-containing protein [Bryobacteraceae bacterium]|nr:SBBP repeat-containing protein [Bryobacteraceae bacterium]
MRFAPLFLAVQLFAAAGGSTVLIDKTGNVWRTGQSNTLVTTATAFQETAVSEVCGTENLTPFQSPVPLNCSHAYLTKQDSAGNLLYATYLAGSSEDGGTALTTDAQGNVYVAGYTYSPDFPVTAGVLQSRNAGPTTPTVYTALGAPYGPAYVVPGGDGFVAKFASDGALLFSTLLGGSGEDLPTLIAVDASGSIYVSGVTMSQDFPVTPNALTSQGTSNFFARLNSNGTTLTYSTYFLSRILAFDLDHEGRAYLTGNLASGQPYVVILDTVAGTVTQSPVLPEISAAGVAIAFSPSGIALAVSPAPLPYDADFYPTPPVRVPGDSYLLGLTSGGAVVSEIHVAQSQFDSILLDSAGNVYAFGHGTGAIPSAPVQLLSTACTPNGGTFVIEESPAGAIAASTYLRQGGDSAIAAGDPGHLTVYRDSSSTTVPVDLTIQPAALFGCALNLATGQLGNGLAPGEIFMLTGTGLGPAQGIGAAPDASGDYPTSLGGVQVLLGSKPLPLLYVSATEIHSVAPFGGIPSGTTVQVQYGNSNPPPLDLPAANLNPGIFEVNGQGALINQDGTVNTPANPAPLGSIVSVYCTGTGYLENLPVDGSLAPIPPPFDVTELTDPELQFAGIAGNTLWSGAAPGLIEGVTQINVQLPPSLPSGTTLSVVPVILDTAGTLSPPVNISVKQ